MKKEEASVITKLAGGNDYGYDSIDITDEEVATADDTMLRYNKKKKTLVISLVRGTTLLIVIGSICLWGAKSYFGSSPPKEMNMKKVGLPKVAKKKMDMAKLPWLATEEEGANVMSGSCRNGWCCEDPNFDCMDPPCVCFYPPDSCRLEYGDACLLGCQCKSNKCCLWWSPFGLKCCE